MSPEEEEEQRQEAIYESYWTVLDWLPGVSLACWNSLEDDALHAARYSPNAIETLCGKNVWTPEGVFTGQSGVGIPIPWETGAANPPPKLGGGYRTICVTCVEESTTDQEEI